MKHLIPVFLILFSTVSFGQADPSVTIIDFVKIKNNNTKEAIYYYEKNWKASRDIALAKGFIKSYRLLSTTADSAADFDLVLITEFKDSAQYNLVEERFQAIFKEMRTGGPTLLNDIKPSEFRRIVFNKKAETIFKSGN